MSGRCHYVPSKTCASQQAKEAWAALVRQALCCGDSGSATGSNKVARQATSAYERWWVRTWMEATLDDGQRRVWLGGHFVC